MLKSDIYIGTIKKCFNLKKYNKYGNFYFKENLSQPFVGVLESYVREITSKAILVKYLDKYIWLNSLTDYIFLTCNHPLNILSTKPLKNNDLFVDATALVPYFNQDIEEPISALKLRKNIKKNFNK